MYIDTYESKMVIKRIIHYAASFIGSFLILIGLAIVAMYVYGAVITRWGESDQSLLFWHLPLLFFGIISVACGLAASLWGINRIKTSSEVEDANTLIDVRNKNGIDRN